MGSSLVLVGPTYSIITTLYTLICTKMDLSSCGWMPVSFSYILNEELNCESENKFLFGEYWLQFVQNGLKMSRSDNPNRPSTFLTYVPHIILKGCVDRLPLASRSLVFFTGGQFNCAAEITSEMDFRKDSQRHFLRCKISARLLMGNSIAPLSFHLRRIFSKGTKCLDMSQISARFSARFSAAQSNCAPDE